MSIADVGEWRVERGLDVVVDVSIAASAEVVFEQIPLAAVWRLVRAGVPIVDVSAPDPRPFLFVALSVILDNNGFPCTAVVVDRRGQGRWALEDDDYLQYARRTGVQEVYDRLEAAVTELFSQWGNDRHLAEDTVRTIAALAVVEYTNGLKPGVANFWRVQDMADRRVGSQPVEPSGSSAETIADALSMEAYGAKRPHLPSAIVGSSYSETEVVTDKQGLYLVDGNVANPDDVQRASVAVKAWHPMSDFTRSQVAPDPTGDLAILLASGGGLELLSALYDDDELKGEEWQERVATRTSDRLHELIDHGGLTRDQAKAFVLAEMGLSQRQVAERLGKDPSTISRTLRRAAERLAQR
ncbi:MAG: hypothetical protein JWM85_1656 [Acidimicrobiaceae bacterium]|nr:hypothetical protein [Acidimicrobiaceae bacterium]